jgi:hypothetical protein
LSARISAAIASRRASRTVMCCVPPFHSGSGAAAATAGAAGAAAAFGFSSTFASTRGASVLAAGAGVSATAALSPSPASTQIGVFTATPSVPSSTRIFATVPSSTASTSIVALSVSISQITCPDFTASPTLTCHLASLPSVMVGDRAGIRT